MANKKQQKQQKPKFSAVWIYVPLLFMIGYMYFFGANGGDPVKKEWFEVKEQMIPQGDVEKITFVSNEKLAEVTIKKDSLSKYKNMFGGREPKYGPHFFFKVSGNFEAEQQFEQARARCGVSTSTLRPTASVSIRASSICSSMSQGSRICRGSAPRPP